jgi:hypothetical protein
MLSDFPRSRRFDGIVWKTKRPDILFGIGMFGAAEIRHNIIFITTVFDISTAEIILVLFSSSRANLYLTASGGYMYCPRLLPQSSLQSLKSAENSSTYIKTVKQHRLKSRRNSKSISN